MLFSLTETHGVHVFDVAVLAAEAFLLIVLSAVLLAGRRDPRVARARP